jgi:hypothetical protein
MYDGTVMLWVPGNAIVGANLAGFEQTKITQNRP